MAEAISTSGLAELEHHKLELTALVEKLEAQLEAAKGLVKEQDETIQRGIDFCDERTSQRDEARGRLRDIASEVFIGGGRQSDVQYIETAKLAKIHRLATATEEGE